MRLKIYLDNCCFNRPYDNQLLIRNRLETEAKLYIQESIIEENYDLAWSYILDFENSRNPFSDRKKEISTWRTIAKFQVMETEKILLCAEELQKLHIKSKDALHIACAIEANCNYFVTTDDKLLNKNSLIDQIIIISPIGFIEIVEE